MCLVGSFGDAARSLERRRNGVASHGLGRGHDILLGGFDGDGETDLGGVLEDQN